MLNVLKLMIVVFAFFAFGLISCARAPMVPFYTIEDRVPRPKANEGRTFFYRGPYSGARGDVLGKIKLNGEVIGVLTQPSVFFVDLPIGKYMFEGIAGMQLFGGETKLEVNLSPGETRYVEWLWKRGVFQGVTLVVVHPDEGKGAIRNLPYTGTMLHLETHPPETDLGNSGTNGD